MDRFRRCRRTLTAGVAVLLLGAPLTAGAGRASAAGRTVRVMQFNFCGAICNKGGRFVDTDPQRAPTRGQKIDYVLFSRGHFSNPSGGPQTSKYSDHKVLLGQATRQ
jgi:hypothetical protein